MLTITCWFAQGNQQDQEQELHNSAVCMVVIQTMVNMLAVTNQEIFHLLRLQFSHHLSIVGAHVC